MPSPSSIIFVLAGNFRQADTFIRHVRLSRTGVRFITCREDLARMRGIYAPDVFVFGTPSAQLKEETLIHVREQKGTVYEVIDDRIASPGRYPVHIDTVTTLVENVYRNLHGTR